MVPSRTHVLELTMREDPPAKAALQSPMRMLWQAQCKVYELLEQAVLSSEMLGL